MARQTKDDMRSIFFGRRLRREGDGLLLDVCGPSAGQAKLLLDTCDPLSGQERSRTAESDTRLATAHKHNQGCGYEQRGYFVPHRFSPQLHHQIR